MAKTVRQEWNVDLGDYEQCNVVFENNKVSVDHGEMVKLTKFKGLKGNILEKPYEIPVRGRNAVLYMKGGQPILTMNGVDCATGQPYQPVQIPGWIWVFYVLYIVNFFVVLGGALGGAAWAGCAYLSARIATDEKKTTAVRAILCTVLYLGASAVAFCIALAIAFSMR